MLPCRAENASLLMAHLLVQNVKTPIQWHNRPDAGHRPEWDVIRSSTECQGQVGWNTATPQPARGDSPRPLAPEGQQGTN